MPLTNRKFLFKRLGIILLALVIANPCPLPLLWAASGPSRNVRPSLLPPVTSSPLVWQSNYGHLPLAFEPNQGQADSRAQFLCRGRGYSLCLTSEGAVLSLHKPRPGPSPQSFRSQAGRFAARPVAAAPAPPDVIGLRWEGAQGSVSYEGAEKLPGVSNYLIGNDRSQWHTNIPQYAKVTAKEVYPGTDVTYYGNQGKLEYDFTVKPGADPKAIRLRADGVKKATVTGQGDLELETAGGKVILRAPTTYQETGGQRKAVTAGYRMKKDGGISVEVGDYDKAKPLVIDPVLDYSTYLGGNIDDEMARIAVDAAGNAYVGGDSQGNFPVTSEAYQTTPTSSINMVISKIDPTGSNLLYATYLGGPASSTVLTGIAVNGAGNVFFMADAPAVFPTTEGSYEPASTAGGPAVGELNPDGAALVYSTFLGKGGSNGGRMALSPSGKIYVTGVTNGDLPATPGAYQTAIQGSLSVFLAELNPAGGGTSDLLFCTYLGCTGGFPSVNGNGSWGAGDFSLALGPGGNVYLAGTAYAGMPVTPGSYQSAPGNSSSPVAPFIAVFNSTGTSLLYCTYVGFSFFGALAVDSSGAAYITGYTANGFPTTSGAFQTMPNSGFDCFVAKVAPAGHGAADLVYSTFLGGTGGWDIAEAIAVDALGRAYVSGYTTDSDFPTTEGAYQVSRTGSENNAFLTQLNPQGTGLLYSTYFDGTSADSVGQGVALGPDGGVYLIGSAGSNFPTTSSVFQAGYGGGLETGFVTKFDASQFGNQAATPTPTFTATNTPTATATFTPTATPTATPTFEFSRDCWDGPCYLQCRAVSGGGVSLTWKAASGIAFRKPDGFLLYRAVSSDGPYALIQTLGDTTTATDQPGPGTWCYTVMAFKGGNAGEAAEPCRITVAGGANQVAAGKDNGTSADLASGQEGVSTDTPTPVFARLIQTVAAVPNLSTGGQPIRFLVNLDQPAQVQLGLFSLTGELVFSGQIEGNQGSNTLVWNLQNTSRQAVASGLYIYILRVDNGGPQETHVGKVAVLR